MTTLAYKDGLLAADSQMTVGDTRLVSSDKIHILSKDTIFAAAGFDVSINKAKRFFSKPDWEELLSDSEKVPVLTKDMDAILIHKGVVYTIGKDMEPDPMGDMPFIACGSGWQFALSAMAFGKSAPEAVVFASGWDVYTNDKVKVLNVTEFYEKQKTKGTGRKGRSKGAAPVEDQEEGS